MIFHDLYHEKNTRQLTNKFLIIKEKFVFNIIEREKSLLFPHQKKKIWGMKQIRVYNGKSLRILTKFSMDFFLDKSASSF